MSGIFTEAEEFLAVAPVGSLLAVDVGTKSLGLAASDGLRTVASPLKTLERTRFHRDAPKIAQAIAERGCTGLVVGLPVNMGGQSGSKAQAAKAFARNAFQAFGLPILLWDERLSTVEAERDLIIADVSRAKRREIIDAIAARNILQGAMDRLEVLSMEQGSE